MKDPTLKPMKVTRGKGRGSNFFVLGHSAWEKLWQIECRNRMNLITAYLVLLAGTGSDHRLTKWSAKACEDHAGMGKPRAKLAINELIEAGLVERTAESTRLSPQYVLPHVPDEAEPIFLPVELITGLTTETSILRRVRETGNVQMLRMLVELYGFVDIDVSYGIPLGTLRQIVSGGGGTQKISEVGTHALWALSNGSTMQAAGEWTAKYRIKASNTEQAWEPFWESIKTLQKIGALVFEPWVCNSDEEDAEPLFPVDPGALYSSSYQGDSETQLTRLISEVAYLLAGDREYILDRFPHDIILPLPLHYRAPAIQGFAKLRVEADTPGRRMAFAMRKSRVGQYLKAYERLRDEIMAGRLDTPLRISANREAV
ncbi:hypothetical protein [Sphingomonas ursincola]|uniref:hypothetical protein n=1 Tax=Sphingomonas ursincola TaxID=56361 RepID=UPI0023571A37|nr:hypothetical protein [Sphingomonas ursincola]MBY0621438.1 hypothetical protein [Sphingomonas ursincola]